MIDILLVSRYRAFSSFDAGLASHGVNIARADSGTRGLSMVAEEKFDLVVSDEHLGDMNGLEFVRGVVSKNPTVNSALVSSLDPDDFHEASEGLGILLQLPVRPGPEHAEKLLSHLNTIFQKRR